MLHIIVAYMKLTVSLLLVGYSLTVFFNSHTGNFVKTKYNLSSGYMPSFQKKEVGSVGQRIQLAPLAGQHASKDTTTLHYKPESQVWSARCRVILF